jgi:hypothetical protein
MFGNDQIVVCALGNQGFTLLNGFRRSNFFEVFELISNARLSFRFSDLSFASEFSDVSFASEFSDVSFASEFSALAFQFFELLMLNMISSCFVQ